MPDQILTMTGTGKNRGGILTFQRGELRAVTHDQLGTGDFLHHMGQQNRTGLEFRTRFRRRHGGYRALFRLSLIHI